MRLLKLFYFSALFFITACNAQKSMIEYSQAQRGNTGHRGIIPKEEEHTPLKGKDYFTVQLKTVKAATLELVSLTVKENEGQVVLKPVFVDANISKMKTKAGEMYIIRVEKEENCKIVKATIEKEGLLTVKVNGKIQSIPIETFEMIMPQ
jgi:hypothetical protein